MFKRKGRLTFQFPTSNHFFWGGGLVTFRGPPLSMKLVDCFGIILKGWNFFQHIQFVGFLPGGFLTCTVLVPTKNMYLEPSHGLYLVNSPKRDQPSNQNKGHGWVLGIYNKQIQLGMQVTPARQHYFLRERRDPNI